MIVKLILINVLLFLLCMILFVLMVAGINYLMGAAPHEVEIGMAYIAVAGLHLYINYRLLKKREMASVKNKAISAIVIIAAYIIYLFIYKG
jgi:uncharacterized membrane protein